MAMLQGKSIGLQLARITAEGACGRYALDSRIDLRNITFVFINDGRRAHAEQTVDPIRTCSR